MTADDDHSDLRASWDSLRACLIGLRKRLDFGDDTFHVEFEVKAKRAQDLALYLDAAVISSDRNLYQPALAIVRSCVEHIALDWLVFSGRTFLQRVKNVSLETWAAWQQDHEAAAEWTKTITKWSRTQKGDVVIRREGLYTEPDADGNRDQLSIYYFLLEQYDGLIGRPADQVDDDFLSLDELRNLAGENQARWNIYLRWSALLENLVENGLLEDEDRGRLGVHYRFLSLFAHPVADNERRLRGARLGGAEPAYNHYASELVLLYVVSLAALELRNYRAGVLMRFGADIEGSDDMDRDLELADRATDYFWFMGNEPGQWDVHRAANRVAFQQLRAGGSLPPTATAPEAQFPSDPLARLVSQHANSRGRVDGFEYLSPWPRSDART